MEPDVGDLQFAVELKLQLSRLSFGRHEGMSSLGPRWDSSELDTLGAPVYFGRCFFGRNNLGQYPDEHFGVNCQYHGHKEVRISDGILGEIRNNDWTDYSFASVYAEDERRAQIEILLNTNIFEKIQMAKNAVNFLLVTSFNEHKKITEDQFEGKKPDNIIIEGTPGRISITDKFTLDIGEQDFGRWWFRVRLASLDFPYAESPPALKD